jgi:TetR/AcrR family transcriptional repressor of mexJK operon
VVAAGEGTRLPRILDAARACFLERGLTPTSMDLVAQRAGVSKATVYAYFDSKHALFAAVMRRERERFGRDLAAISAREHTDMAAMLTEIGEQFLDFVTSPPVLTLFRVIIAEVSRFPELGQSVLAGGRAEFVRLLAEALQHGIDSGRLEIADPSRAAIQFVSLLKGDVHLTCLLDPGHRPSKASIRRQVAESVELFLSYYGAQGAAAPAPRKIRRNRSNPG